jgi:hypothetical protein
MRKTCSNFVTGDPSGRVRRVSPELDIGPFISLEPNNPRKVG